MSQINTSNNDSLQENQHQLNFICPAFNSDDVAGQKKSDKSGDSYKEPTEKVVNAKEAKSSPLRKRRNKQMKKSRKKGWSSSLNFESEQIKTKDRKRKLEGGKGKDHLAHLILQPMTQIRRFFLKLLISKTSSYISYIYWKNIVPSLRLNKFRNINRVIHSKIP